jgi:hypothetical protein
MSDRDRRFGVILSATWALLAVLFGGCCWMAKRSCYPACKPPPPAKVVTVEKTCELPVLKLPGFKETTAGCPDDHICLDKGEGAKLYLRLARLRDFAILARKRCAPLPASQPTSQPAK